ncbi:hypothetical protein QM467_07870 [Rhodoblastus sp. 17X3]|uniref:calcium-binding protein n=1 Tax=Rhodoblastus sp. 17X3 TaxID=3047026 RepID=UPI0024B85421|nr:hypothetical protein [Rhodoblastus sp. 17X3]MDI9847970.1 hypothetical protein [Rhodoblastus sp. 17X3]
MATYDLDQCRLDALLDRTVSRATENAILGALKDAGLLPHKPDAIGGEVQLLGGAYTIPTFDHFFLDAGKSSSMTLTSHGGVVIASGDGANFILDQGPGGDTLIGGAGAEKLQVTQGDNELIAGNGLNTLIGGTGHDRLVGGGASLLEAGSGGSTLIGGANFDYYSGGDPDDHGHQGDRNDWGQGNESGLGHDHTYQTIPMDTLIGGPGDDLLKVLHGDNAIYAGAGRDTIYAGDGHDTIYGSTMPSATGAMDTIYLGTGNTSIQGGAAGAATIYAGMHGNDTIIGTAAGQELTVYSEQSSHAIKSTTVQGGVTTITFKDHQSLALENLTIHFSNGDIFKA